MTGASRLRPRKVQSWFFAFLAAAVLAGTCFALGKPAEPGTPAVSGVTRGGRPLRWVRPKIVLHIVPPKGGVSAHDLGAALADGMRAWNEALRGCSAPTLELGAPLDPSRKLRQDGVSAVFVRSRSWCPDDAKGEDDCYDAARAAITHLYPVDAPTSSKDGELDEADLEINAAHHHYALNDAPGTRSLQALVAHELGHVLGLDHSCVPGKTARPLRRGGPTLPPCSAPLSKRSIMYPDPGTSGDAIVTPGPAEVRLLCNLYAARKPP